MRSSTLSLSGQRLGLLTAGALAGVLVSVIAGTAGQTARAQDDDGQREHTISVDGTGTVKIRPDVADVSLGVRVQRDRAGDASADAAEQMAAVVAALLAQGVAEDDIQTTELSLNAVYDWDRSPARLVGYEAANIVSIVVRDLTTVGAIVDAAVDAGATSINGISFRLEDTTAIETQAREAAMNDARAKADELAGAAGVAITGVISIVETGGPVPMPVYYGEAAGRMAADAQTPVLAGNVEVVVNVAVIYSIE
jgi:uncharacterized protein YggE